MVALNKEKMMKKINDNKYGTGFYYTHKKHIFVPRTNETRQKKYYECVYSPVFCDSVDPSLFNLTSKDMYERKSFYDLEYVNDELSFTETSISSLKAIADFANSVMTVHSILKKIRKMTDSDYLDYLKEKKAA